MASKVGVKIAVAKILRPHGLKGGLKVHLYSEASILWEKPATLAVGTSPNQLQTVHIDAIEKLPNRQSCIVYLNGCDSFTAAEAFKNQQLWIDESILPPLSGDEYYHHQLQGLAVVHPRLGLLGKVSAIATNVGADNLIVDNGKEQHWIPMIRDAIARIDLEAQTIYVNDMPGLTDGENE